MEIVSLELKATDRAEKSERVESQNNSLLLLVFSFVDYKKHRVTPLKVKSPENVCISVQCP